MIFVKPLAMLYHLASHLSTLGERESEGNECEESEKGDMSEFEPLAKRPCTTRSGRHASSFILSFCINILSK